MQLFQAMDELRVPVHRVQVEVHTDLEHRPATVFLAPGSSLEDILEGEGAFFPTEEEGGGIRLYARAAVVAFVEPASEVTQGAFAVLGPGYQTRFVAVHFRNGRVVRGGVSLYGLARTLDLLNRPAKTFVLYADLRLYHIVKAHISRVEEQQ
jgi:hypothetical protein